MSESNPMPTAPLYLENISKSYDSQVVLQGISLSLIPGEIYGLIGLNGVGKTTLIKIILGLASADAGEVTIFGVPHTCDAARKTLCYLPEKFQPSKYLKGEEYLRLSLAHYHVPYHRREALRHASALGLDADKLSLRVGAYSKGMGQKLGLIGAFMTGTPLLILDEPMSGLDPSARIRLKQFMQEARAAGRTVFFSSHILSDIDEICDRIGVMHRGRLMYNGAPGAFKAGHPGQSLEHSFLRAIEAA